MERLCAAGTSLMSLELVTVYFPHPSFLTFDNSFPGVRKTLGLFWSFNLQFLLVIHAYLDRLIL